MEKFYTKIDDRNYIFDAKVLLNDFYKTLQINEDIFEQERGDSDTLAGLILEVLGELPRQNTEVKIKKFTFTVTSGDNRKINKLHVKINS